MVVRRIEIVCPLVCIKRICCLVVAGLVQGTKVIPHLGDVGIQSDSSRVRIKRVPILVDLIVQNPNGAPKCRVAAITVDRLLVGLIGLGVLLL